MKRILRGFSSALVLLLTSHSVIAVDATPVAVSKTPKSEIHVELIGTLRIDGTARDLSPTSDAVLEDGSPANQFGGLSAIEYSGVGNRFLLLPDRGAGDGLVHYHCRYHETDLIVDPQTKKITFKLISTHNLSTANGKPLVGALAAHEEHLKSNDPSHVWNALDCEGLRKLSNGSLLISDEYGPHVFVVDQSGRVSEEFPIPEKFHHRLPINGKPSRGVAYNRGLEGIAITPSGNRLIAMPQSPLIQDSLLQDGKSMGHHCRCIIFDAKHACVQEVVYSMDEMSNGLCEILAIDENRFLVIERDGNSGLDAKHKKIYLANLTGATDVRKVDSLPQTKLSKGVKAMSKTLCIDLLDERFGLGGEKAHEKPEGLCWGPKLPDGRRTLWVCCDNDFDPAIQSEIYCFAIAGL